ncbi:hypothetical protein EYF80_033512 [Liparis tanakae]|uniref:Uncharacterized protein n=1 Tax=Liparis tanakae TaxID=230148 RepID=A0A4Z2GS53_9TELE|nr:hypothetical protein EYF80_033512 [Liparis tanakae]
MKADSLVKFSDVAAMVTLDDGEQRLVNGEEHRLVDGGAQVVEGQQLERAQHQYDVVRVADEPLPLAQQ